MENKEPNYERSCGADILKDREYWDIEEFAYGNGYFWGNSQHYDIKKANEILKCSPSIKEGDPNNKNGSQGNWSLRKVTCMKCATEEGFKAYHHEYDRD